MPVLTLHPAAASTSPASRQALFAQAGIITTRDVGELLEVAALLASQPVPAGGRVVVVSSAAANGQLAARACTRAGLQVATLSARTQENLRRMLPPGAEVTGPVDTTPAVTPGAFGQCLEAVAADQGVDAVLALTVPAAIAGLVPVVCAANVQKTPRACSARPARSSLAAAPYA
jgi:acyl-CoA synthetase (NDP forming)